MFICNPIFKIFVAHFTTYLLLNIAGAQHLVENHFADTAFRLLRRLVEKNSQVRHLVEIVTFQFYWVKSKYL